MYSIPGKHWADGRARVLVHPDLDLDEQATARELRGLDHPQTPAADDRGPTGLSATDHMEENHDHDPRCCLRRSSHRPA